MPGPLGLLVDIDGVLFVGDEPVPGAAQALERLRSGSAGLRLMTNMTSRPRRAIAEHLRALGFAVDDDDVLAPAAIAVEHCRRHGLHRVALLADDALREDLGDLEVVPVSEGVDAVILGELGDRAGLATLNPAFRALLDGAELLILGRNRYFARADGLTLDVGAWAAALEYASGRDGVVVGKPSPAFFAAGVEAVGVDAADAVMVGDDVESDVGGALDAGLRGVLVRTGKYRAEHVERSGVRPTAIVDSIADVPELLGM